MSKPIKAPSKWLPVQQMRKLMIAVAEQTPLSELNLDDEEEEEEDTSHFDPEHDDNPGWRSWTW